MKEFDSAVFTRWINSKYDEFRQGDARLKIVDFAKHLGNRSQTVSYWLLGKLAKRPSQEQCQKLIETYGHEAYAPLGIDPPLESDVFALLSEDEANSLISALEEIRESGLFKGNAKTSPEDVRMIKEIFSSWGVNFSEIMGRLDIN